MDRLQSSMVYDFGILRRVLAHYDDSRLPRSLFLEFDDSEVVELSVNVDDDTIVLKTGLPPSSAREVPPDSPWLDVLGHKPVSVWMLQNQQGYVDGIQIALQSPDTQNEICLQLIAIVSQLETYTVKVNSADTL